jgi:hypothetical protein
MRRFEHVMDMHKNVWPNAKIYSIDFKNFDTHVPYYDVIRIKQRIAGDR